MGLYTLSALVFFGAVVLRAEASDDVSTLQTPVSKPHIAPTGDPLQEVGSPKWLEYHRSRAQDAFWRLVVEITPFMHIRGTSYVKPDYHSPIGPPHPLTERVSKNWNNMITKVEANSKDHVNYEMGKEVTPLAQEDQKGMERFISMEDLEELGASDYFSVDDPTNYLYSFNNGLSQFHPFGDSGGVALFQKLREVLLGQKGTDSSQSQYPTATSSKQRHPQGKQSSFFNGAKKGKKKFGVDDRYRSQRLEVPIESGRRQLYGGSPHWGYYGGTFKHLSRPYRG